MKNLLILALLIFLAILVVVIWKRIAYQGWHITIAVLTKLRDSNRNLTANLLALQTGFSVRVVTATLRQCVNNGWVYESEAKFADEPSYRITPDGLALLEQESYRHNE